MAVDLLVGGTIYKYPVEGEDPGRYGEEATGWAIAITEGIAAINGPGDILQTNFNIDNNQSTYSDITGFLFNSSVVKGITVSYRIERTNNTTYLVEKGSMEILYNPQTTTWSLSREFIGEGGIDIDILASGQVQYKVNTQILSPSQTSGFIRFETTSTLT